MSENLYDGQKGIKELNTADLTKKSDGTALPHLDEFKGIVYMLIFYAPWCGFCHKMADDVKALANTLHDEGFLVGAVNCERNSDIDDKIQISSFPTVYFVKDSKAELYTKGRDLASMVNFLCETLGKCSKKK